MTGMTKDLETMLGNPRKAIISMAGPLLVAYLVIQLNSFLDISWCSGLGPTASSSVSSMVPMCWVIAGLGTGLGVGATAAIAARLGRGEKEKADSLASQTLMMAAVIGVAFTPVLYFLVDPIIAMMGVGDIAGECRSYACPMMLGSSVIVLNCVIAGLLRSEGAAKKAMIVQISAAAIHMCLDPLFIYTLGFGLSGAAYATVVAAAISTAVGLWWYVRGKMYITLSLRNFRFRKADCMDVLNVGVPRGMEIIIISAMAMIQRIFVVKCGGYEGAMFYNMPWNFVMLAQAVSQSFGSALIPVCTAALAVGDRKKAAEGYVYSLKTSVISMCIIGLLLGVFADYAVILFTYEADMAAKREMFAHVLRIFSLIIPMMALIDIGSAMLQSLRKAQISMYSSFLRNFFIVIVLVWASAVSMDAVFWSLAASEVFGGLLMIGLAFKVFGCKLDWHVRKSV